MPLRCRGKQDHSGSLGSSRTCYKVCFVADRHTHQRTGVSNTQSSYRIKKESSHLRLGGRPPAGLKGSAGGLFWRGAVESCDSKQLYSSAKIGTIVSYGKLSGMEVFMNIVRLVRQSTKLCFVLV